MWVMDASGGEARPVTSSPKGVADFAWSPDGERLVYCADVEPPAGAGESGGGPKVTVVNRVRYRYDSMGWRGNAHHHLFVVNVGGGDPVQITDGDWDDFSPVWSPDGSKIAFISGRRDDRDLRALTEVYVVPAQGGEAEEWSQGLYSAGAAVWAPGGDRLAAMGSDAPEGWRSGRAGCTFLKKAGSPGASPTTVCGPFWDSQGSAVIRISSGRGTATATARCFSWGNGTAGAVSTRPKPMARA